MSRHRLVSTGASPHGVLFGRRLLVILALFLCFLRPSHPKKLGVDLTVDSSMAVSKISGSEWACVNLDWWPSSKCDYGNCGMWSNLSMLSINLNDPMLLKAVAAFHGKVRLRLGGSLGDFVVYDTGVSPLAGGDGSADYCKFSDFSTPVMSTKIGYELFSGCLRMDRWDALNLFCLKAGCSIVFGLNGLYGRTPPPPCPADTNCRIPGPPECCTMWSGSWNPINAEALVRYTRTKRYPVSAWELGNELVGKRGIESHIGVEEYLSDWKRFVNMINSVYPRRNERPLLVVPDTTWMTDWFGTFLRKLNGLDPAYSPDVVSHHLYSLGAGVKEDAWRTALNDSVMNQVLALGKQVQSVVSKASPHAQVWLGEGGGCYNSGSNNVTNAFNSGFWFLDQMGALASTGHSSFCRQTLAGGFYGLLDSKTLHPNPDYYSLLLWSRLMGANVLQMSRGQAASATTLRAYAHCMAPTAPSYIPGGIALLLINLSNTTAVQATLYTTERRDLLSLGRDEYFFSSGCRTSQLEGVAAMRELLACRSVLLNGLPLHVGDDGAIPDMKPAAARGASPLVVKPLTYGFVTFPKAKAAACFDDAPTQEKDPAAKGKIGKNGENLRR